MTKKKLEINPSHDRVLEKLKEHGASIAAHSTGSGKTSLSWRAADMIGGKTLMITPASVVTNMERAKGEFGFKSTPTIMSYEKASNNAEELAQTPWDLVVFDEAHRLRNTETARVKAMRQIIENSHHVLMLTATPDYNKPEDVPNLISLATKGEVKPSVTVDKQVITPTFLERVLKGIKPTTIENVVIPKKDQGDIKKYVHVYDPASQDRKEDFPGMVEQKVIVPMSPEQRKLYSYYERDLSPTLKWKIRMGIPADKADASRLSVFANSFRQISNGTQGFSASPEKEPISPKISLAVQRLKKMSEGLPNFRAVVYSNYLASGLEPYKKELNSTQIPYTEITGSLTKKEKDKAVSDYNSGKTPVLLISSAGSEGLDLKGTKLIQVLEPHFNNSKIEQVLGRGRRFKSHSHLPPEERFVLAEHYLTQKDKDVPAMDEYLFNNSIRKGEQGNEILQHAEVTSA